MIFFFFSTRSGDEHVYTQTYVNDGVRLDVVHVWVAETQFFAPPLGGADNPRGDGVLQGERAANGNHKLSGTQVCRASQQQDGQLHLRCRTTRGEQDQRQNVV